MPNTNKLTKISAFFAALWAALLILLPFIPSNLLNSAADTVADIIMLLIKTIFDEPSDKVLQIVLSLTLMGLPLLFFCLFAFLMWNYCRIKGANAKKTIILSLALTAVIAAIFELAQLLQSGLNPRFYHFLINTAGGAATIGFIFLVRRFPRVFNRETVSYVICGALTTLVNMVVYGLCYNSLSINNLISNTVAWVISVLFAYVVNKIFVFQSRTSGFNEIAREIGLFVGARLFSYAVDMAGMWIMVDMLKLNGGLSKIAVNVIVLIMNYFFSKLIIFKKTDNGQPV